jgi:hypothetical protein
VDQQTHQAIVDAHVTVPAPGTTTPPVPVAAKMIELYALEYTTASARYENVYKALWQNFNYLTVLAAGILAFGKDGLGLPLSSVLTALVFILWYWSSFEPLNHYGDRTALRLGKIENLLTTLGMQKLPGLSVDSTEFGLRHFVEFNALAAGSGSKMNLCCRWIVCALIVLGIAVVVKMMQITILATAIWWVSVGGMGLLLALVGALLWRDFEPRLRVRTVVQIFAAILHLFVLSVLLKTGPGWEYLRPPPSKPPQTQPVRVLMDESDKLTIQNIATITKVRAMGTAPAPVVPAL